MTAIWDLEQLEQDLIGVTVERAMRTLAERGLDADFQPTGPEPAPDDVDTSVKRVIQVRPVPSRLIVIYGRFRRYPHHGVD
ncbi:hypothetical protein HM1_2260 [Heliomicrobium modesticaldum Ice1]|uniref:PASTA domain-containing protein n=1 Tax=Heliobacterium modesticaldum (strain ATCC 51547 / Ice1) TaxID=498761 RepID=B0THE1_HELMI|nr:hypothetical protein [Heliomicrobium modesticaldum]ABZ84816.1 hypothetical protein HM1_2260 [Heliomicrobium modesticaldum Ice1]